LIDWDSLDVARWWPLGLAAITVALLFAMWHYRRRRLISDMNLVTATRSATGLGDRLPLAGGAVLLSLLTIAMMEPSIVRVETAAQRARDFLILVDTSRSMRHDTGVRRDAFQLNFERRAGGFDTVVDDPNTIPHIARYELARESLLSFLSGRGAEDRVGLTYFNDDAYPVSALTSDIAFVTEQLAAMDDYVNWGTDIATAMDSALDLLERYPDGNRRSLILLTDAETRYTRELEQQLARLANSNLSFHLLWITADEDGPGEEVASFLKLARAVGTVATIENPDARSLQTALLDIARMEAYSYVETRRTVVLLSPPLLQAARALLIVWLPLMATIFHPGARPADFEARAI
jgi:Mg-chelatase subunit ChlD